MGELVAAKRSLAEKEEEMRKLEERLQRQPRRRRWEQRRASRGYNHFGSQEQDEDWRIH